MMLLSVKETEKMDDIDAMFSDLLGEINTLSQSLMPSADRTEVDSALQTERTFSIGFTDLNESLKELEDHDLDALMADLSRSTTSECSLPTYQQAGSFADNEIAASALPPPSNSAESSGGLQTSEPQTKSDKIKLALEKLKEAKVRKLIVKVLMSDGSSKILMVDERQTVREVLDTLFEKTHCDCSIDWSLCETNPELQIERGFEDHEHVVEPLSSWTRLSENKMYFVSRPQKYVMFTNPQVFYMWKKKKEGSSEINEQAKQLLLQEHFGGSTLIVPDLEGTLYLKEDGKKVWKPRYFVLRASGIYYVPKGKTKHPCIQKESDYIKFLCCDDQHTLLLWVNSIRIAKYGTTLYKNYQVAMKRAHPSASHKGPPPSIESSNSRPRKQI
ncbi:amyloid beta A4 precursor protein-binding family B member 1-interacting protein-like isoform X5 [Trematomus bernacchii]|uniref:amyloid beta A4 precursor protein-binding family B member 1-interacting protein-like isoform X5 n=1 Tax=Trematomus bernacchii TaxID=40690 RepID=UPI00146B1B93|nr:amyloid beta A4 precursor protein-binding family B member 1-interacting protein-like isoform X5 [Trematomus bernacchii]